MSELQGSHVETTKDIPISKAEESSVGPAKGIALAFLGFGAMASVAAMFGLGLILFAIFRLLIPLLSLSVMVRRLHDTGRSGWACLIGLVPLIGGFILFVWLCEDSDPGENEYGKNPKGL